ncbi:hypothetical protein GRAN_1470 [Granulicella sibirica]|uniref:Uncharacterized protein n=1 Tax=Granulicella sibirica TaxID=2479048 RepID=A0A4Q0T695_9BACT|nr:hypothetical protein GRAN_1470 [Granulicella sibirica]
MWKFESDQSVPAGTEICSGLKDLGLMLPFLFTAAYHDGAWWYQGFESLFIV